MNEFEFLSGVLTGCFLCLALEGIFILILALFSKRERRKSTKTK